MSSQRQPSDDGPDVHALRKLHRAVNEGIESIDIAAFFQGSGVFLCECGRAECHERIDIGAADFRAAREKGEFLVKPEHVDDGADVLVELRDGFAIVKLAGRA